MHVTDKADVSWTAKNEEDSNDFFLFNSDLFYSDRLTIYDLYSVCSLSVLKP